MTIRLDGAGRAVVQLTDLETNASLPPIRMGRRGDALTAQGPLLPPGLYRLGVTVPATPSITQLVLVVP